MTQCIKHHAEFNQQCKSTTHSTKAVGEPANVMSPRSFASASTPTLQVHPTTPDASADPHHARVQQLEGRCPLPPLWCGSLMLPALCCGCGGGGDCGGGGCVDCGGGGGG